MLGKQPWRSLCRQLEEMGRRLVALIQERLVRLPQENLALKQRKVACAAEHTVLTGDLQSPLSMCCNQHSAVWGGVYSAAA